MNSEFINSEPDEPRHENVNLLKSRNQSQQVNKRQKRNAMQDNTTLQLFSDQIIQEKQIQFRPSILSLFLKNIYVKRFLNRLLQKKKIKTQNSQEIFDLIADSSANFIQAQNKIQLLPSLLDINFFERIRKMIKCLLQQKIIKFITQLPIIQPESQFKIGFDILGTCSRLYFLYLIPVDLAWAQKAYLFETNFTITLIMEILLITEFMFNLNVAYYQEGNLVKNRKLIAKNLISKSYCIEIFATLIILIALIFPQFQTQQQENTFFNLIYLIFIVHTLTIDRTVTVYETAINLGKKLSSYLTLFKLLMFFFYVVHLFACLWYWVGKYNINNELNWISRTETQDDDWDQQYLISFYYACVTMFTVGYGDITPRTKLEQVVTILFIILSSIQLPYSVNTVGNIIQQISAYGEERKNKLRTINSYMQRKHVPYNLQNQIRQYLDYYWKLQACEESEEEKLIISQLPENLRDNLMIKANHSFFNKVPFFRDNFTIAFKQKLLKKINHIVASPGQIIDIQDKTESSFLFYIEEGQIDVFINEKFKTCIRQVQKQQTLGIDNFILGNNTSEIYRSVGISKLLVLSRKEFITTLKEFPEDFELFCKIKDDMLYNLDIWLYEASCAACKMNSHKIINCPYIHYAPQKDFIIRKFNYQKSQNRRDFSRTKIKLKRYYQQSEFNFIKKQISIISNKMISPLLLTNKTLVPHNPQTHSQPVGTNKSKEINDFQPLRLDYGDKSRTFCSKKNLNIHKQSYKTTQKSPARIMFINAVKKVIAIQRWFGRNDLSMIDRYESSFDCKLIRELIIDLKKAKFVNQRDLEQIEMLLIKTKNLSKYERRNMDAFEQAREYKVYGTNFNIQKVVEKLNGTKYQKYFIRKLQKLLPFIKYPGVYIKQYKVKLKHKKLKRCTGNNLLIQ